MPRCCGTRFLRQGQHQGEGVLGDGVLVGAGRDGDGDAVLGGGGDVHGVVADAGAGDDAQLRVGVEHAARVRLGAGEAGGHALEGRQQLRLDHLRRVRREDQFEAGARSASR